MRVNTVRVKVLCQHQSSRMKCMYACTGAQQGHGLGSPGAVITHYKQLWWERGHCDRLDSDYMRTWVEKKIVFTDVMCTKVFFKTSVHIIYSQGLMISFYLCNPGNS